MNQKRLKKLKETKEEKRMLKNKNGITLIALVVTIVVLLILAGVSISLILDNNGIIKKSKDARREYRQAKTNEQADLSNLSDWIDDTTAEATPKVNVNDKATDNSTINGKKGKAYNPTIPEGYIPINTETSSWGNGTSAPLQDSVDHGLVIKDESDNEWVWIPVPDVTVMCDTANEIEYTLCGTEEETAVKTKLYSKSEIIDLKTRTTPGDLNGYHEPDLVIRDDGPSYDTKEEYYKTVLGFDSKEKMAEAFVTDYSEMIASIKKYGGFYIGRYELSKEGVQKNQPTLTNTNWYNLYKKCKSLNASEKVETRMIWGCQWDVTCDFIANKGEQKSIRYSSSWGNYSDSTTPANTGNYEKKIKKNTGSNEYWKANNIYDLAGNCFEWTQEVYSTVSRAYRGSNCLSSGSIYPASDRDGYFGSPDKRRIQRDAVLVPL